MAPFMTFEHSEAGTKTCNLVWSVRTMELISSMARIRHVGEPIIPTRDLSVHTVAPIGRLFFQTNGSAGEGESAKFFDFF